MSIMPRGLSLVPIGNLHIYANGSKNIRIYFLTLKALSRKTSKLLKEKVLPYRKESVIIRTRSVSPVGGGGQDFPHVKTGSMRILVMLIVSTF